MSTSTSMHLPLGFALPRARRSPPDADCTSAPPGSAPIRIYLIKPSRYDDDGWVMRFRWGVIPNNTLAVVAGLLQRAAASLGIDLECILWDELIDGVIEPETIDAIVARAQRDRVRLAVGLTGVQTSQYPRGRDLALQLRHRGLDVIIGGFHVSSHAQSAAFLQSHGVTVVFGEVESEIDELLQDLAAGRLRAGYHARSGIRARTGGADITVPRLTEAALPALDRRYMQRFFNPTFATLDTSRGCPFACSYCSVKNVMGRTMRPRAPEAILDWIRTAHDEFGVRNLLVVDDDLFRSPGWEEFFQGLAALRRSGRRVALIIQADIESASFGAPGRPASPGEERARRFVDLATAAGCFEVFMGFESFEPANLEHTRKYHNEEREDRRKGSDLRGVAERVRERYRRVVDNWHTAGIGVHCGYMIGLPFDEPGCGARAARTLSDIGVDIATFFAYTPLPGTEDYDRAAEAASIYNLDFNDYDSTHFVARHPRLSAAELRHEYDDAFRTFYSWRRVAWSLLSRHGMPGLGPSARYGMLMQQLYFAYAVRRGWHPMMGGIGRIREGRRRAVVADAEAAALYATATPLTGPGAAIPNHAFLHKAAHE